MHLSRTYMDGYFGGAGINARLLYDLLHHNPLASPLSRRTPSSSGAARWWVPIFPSASRFTVTGKSPLTGNFGDSNAGGWLPVRMKQAGYDHIVIQGKAERPVALLIEPARRPEIIDASAFWGLDVYETDNKFHELYGNCDTARIGPAGENLVKYANIQSGTKRVSTNGRTGMGMSHGVKKPQGHRDKGRKRFQHSDGCGSKKDGRAGALLPERMA